MAFGTLTQTLRTLREIDLRSQRRAAEAPFRLFIIGAGDDARRLADRLSEQAGRVGIHPWLLLHSASEPVASSAESALPVDRLAVLLTRAPDLAPAERSQLNTFASIGIRAVTMVVHDGGPMPLGAELPRAGEAARGVLVETGGAAYDLSPLAAALLQATDDRPGTRLALARQLPALRPAVVAGLIDDTSRSNAVYAMSTGIAEATPGLSLVIGPADILVLTKNQLMLAFKILLASGRTGSNREMLGQVLSVIGSGLLFRQIAHELVGMVPVIGLVPKIAVAYAGTYVIGQSVWAWADRGHRLNRSELRLHYRRALTAAAAWARKALPGTLGGPVPGLDRDADPVTTGPSYPS